jgi:DNA-binding response OmpR family regulator
MVTWWRIFSGRRKHEAAVQEQVLEATGQEQAIDAEGVVLDVLRRRALVDGYVVRLPAREALLLGVLMRQTGQIVSQTELLHAAWGTGDPGDRHLERHVRRLRRRLVPSPLSPIRIHRADEAGYVFEVRST